MENDAIRDANRKALPKILAVMALLLITGFILGFLAADIFRRAALFRKPCAGGIALIGTGDAAGVFRSEDDPHPAFRNVAKAHPDARRHARFAKSR